MIWVPDGLLCTEEEEEREEKEEEEKAGTD